jgi:hypothetical protein
MIYQISLFPGALFQPVEPLQKVLDAFANDAGSYFFLIHPVYGIVLYSSPTKRIWPEIEPGKTIGDFKQFLDDCSHPGETHHLTLFWKKVESLEDNLRDQFVVKGGQNSPGNLLGVIVFQEEWGSLWVLIPAEKSEHLESMTRGFASWKTPGFREALQSWVCESEIESIVGVLLSRMPENLRPISTFWRMIQAKTYWGKIEFQNLSYRFRGNRWQRDLMEGRPEITKVIEKHARRHAGIIIDGKISVCFSVYVGGVRSLGILQIPVEQIREAGLTSLNNFLHKMSRTLCERAAKSILKEFHYARLALQDGHFGMESLEEIAQVISPAHWKTLPVLPLWFDHSQDLSESLQLIDSYRYITDVLFLNSERTYGCLLIADTPIEKAQLAKNKLQRSTGFIMEDFVFLEDYLENH